MINDSSVCVSIVPENAMQTDVKFAVELGFMIMMDKPIIAVVRPGTKVPSKLVLVADIIIESNMQTERDREKLAATIQTFTDQLRKEDDADPSEA